MTSDVKIEHINGNQTVNYSQYFNKTYDGYDRVLQHKIEGVETAHVTVHPGSAPQVTEKKNKQYLKAVVANKMDGFDPSPSKIVLEFIAEVQSVVASS